MVNQKHPSDDEKIAKELSALQRLMEQAGSKDEVIRVPKRPGRPRVEHKELGKVTIRLPQRYQDKLQLIPEGRGAGSKVRFLIDYYVSERERDRRQWQHFYKIFKRCGELWKDRHDHTNAAKLLSAVRELKYLQQFLEYSPLELAERLDGKDLALWEKISRIEVKDS
ncbi:MAG: hypothetical protein HQK50_19620 [Oligoflexia bacterium]|nr:hypothetical protein [Oligoflexia bacterium]